MPTKKTGTTPANKQKGKKTCSCCRREKNLTDFYLSYSPIYSLDQRIPICKDCCKTSILNDDNTINYPKFKRLLMQIDKPLYYDLIESAIESVKNENGYLEDDAVQYRGKDILQKYFTLVVMRQDRQRSYADSEREGFLHQNNNRSKQERKEILDKYQPLFVSIENYNNDDIVISNNASQKTVKWSKKDKQNMKYVMSVVGYDPFEDMNLSDYDKKYCFNILAGYCDAEGISEDGHKIQCVIQLTNLYCQCRKIDETINLELSKIDVDETKVAKLTSSKSSILSSIATIAKDNNISSNYNKNSTQGKNSLSAKMKEIVANGFENMKVNLFDIDTSACMKQIADLSNQSIMEQLTFDSNEYTEMIKEQREMIIKFQDENERLEEENRILKNQIEELESKRK